MSVLGDRWRGGLVHDGAGAGRAPCAVVGNRGPGWNVGGTLILSATVVLRHRSPLPPPICSFQRSYGKRSRTHTHTHIHTHTCVQCTKKKIYTGVFFPPPFLTHTDVRQSLHQQHPPPLPSLFFFFTLLISSFGFSYSAPPASSIFSPPPPPLPRPPSQHLAKLASRFDYAKTTSPPPPNPPSLLPAASTPILCHRGGSES